MSGDAEAETRKDPPGPRDAAPRSDTAFDAGNARFEVGRELGRGGMGRVVAATDRALDRQVAIKQALRDDESHLARFEREVRITARLEHPSIIPVHDAGRDRTGRPYYVMRRLEGDQLSVRIKTAATPRARLGLVPHVLAAVDAAAFAHARRIIHRDIKPENILVGAYGETLLIDWGLARELDEDELPVSQDPARSPSLTHAGGVFGTPGYMSPEQILGNVADERADVYALGATLLHVLLGDSARLHEIARGATVSATPLPAEVPRELIAIVAKAMARDRTDRYRHAGELADDLRAFLTGQLVAAHHYTRRERLARFVRRHRVAVAVTAASLVVIASVAALSFRGVLEERDLARVARADAEHARGLAVEDRQLAMDRAEVMLVERAEALTSSDPTRAVALLRQLPESSRHLRRAREIAEVAAVRGIARGVHTELRNITYLGFTPDDKTLLATGESTRLWAIDVASGTHRSYELDSRPDSVLLLDPEHLLYGGKGGLSLLLLSSGKHASIAPAAAVGPLWSTARGYRYVDRATRTVVERSLQHDEARTLATDAQSAFALGERVVVGGKTLRVVDGDHTIELTTPPGYANFLIGAGARDGQTFAVASLEGVIEWDATGRVLRRWTIEAVSALVYTDGLLLATTTEGKVMVLGDKRIREISHHVGSLWWQAALPTGGAFLDATGNLSIVRSGYRSWFPLQLGGSRTLAASARGRYLAIGSTEGTVRWLDLGLMLPELHRLPRNARACWADDRELLVLDDGRLRKMSRTTGELRDIGKYPVELFFGCQARLGDTLLLPSTLGTFMADLAHGDHAVVPFTGQADLETQRFVYARDRELVDRDPATRRETVVWTAATKIDLFGTLGRWAVATTAPDLLSRIDRATKTVESIRVPGGVMALTIEATGAIVFARAGALWRWDGRTTERLFELPPGAISKVIPSDAGWALYLGDNSLWHVGSGGLVQRVPANSLTFAGMDAEYAWRLEAHRRLFRHHPATGEEVAFELPITSVARFDKGLTLGNGDDFVVVIERKTPRDLAQLHAWIERTTNGYLDSNSALRWRDEPSR